MSTTEEAGVEITTTLDAKGLADFKTRLTALKKDADALKKSGVAAGEGIQRGLKDSGKSAKTLADEIKKTAASLDKLEAAASKARSGFHKSLADTGKSIAGGISGSIRTAGTMAAVGALAIVHSNMEAEKSFRKVAFAQRAAGKEVTNWTDLQKKSFDTIQKWAGSQEGMATGMQTLLDKTGDADFATDALDSVAMASRASGVEIKTLAELAGELNDKFGVTAQEMPDALGQVIELAAQGGQSVEQVTASMDGLGKAAARAGVTGAGGLAKMVALSQQMADQVGGEGVAMKGLSKIMTKLGPDADPKTKALLKQMGVKGNNGMEILGSLMQKTGGDEGKLGKVLSPEHAALLAQGLGKGGFGEAMGRAGSTKMNGEKVKFLAEDAMNAGGAKIEQALGKIAEGLAKPEAVAAIDSIISRLPDLAAALVKGADFITKNPLLSGGAFALSQSGGVLSAFGSIAKAGYEASVAQKALQAATAAQTLASGGATAGVTTLGTASLGAAGSMVALAAAAALAVAAWAVAYDQWKKLQPELEEHDQSVEGQKQSAIESAMRRGDKEVEFEGKKLAVTGKNAKGEWIHDDEILNGANGTYDERKKAQDETSDALGTYNQLFQAKEQQENELKRTRVGSPEWKAANPGIDPNAPGQTFRAGEDPNKASVGPGMRLPAADKPDKARGMSPGDRALFDAMMGANRDLPSKLGAQVLQVRVTNTSDFGDAPPGHSPRK